MHPFGFGMPPILAASFAGPFGKSSYSSLTGTPDSLPSERMLGANPLWSVPADPPARPADMADERLLGQPMPRPPALDVGQEP